MGVTVFYRLNFLQNACEKAVTKACISLPLSGGVASVATAFCPSVEDTSTYYSVSANLNLADFLHNGEVREENL